MSQGDARSRVHSTPAFLRSITKHAFLVSLAVWIPGWVIVRIALACAPRLSGAAIAPELVAESTLLIGSISALILAARWHSGDLHAGVWMGAGAPASASHWKLFVALSWWIPWGATHLALSLAWRATVLLDLSLLAESTVRMAGELSLLASAALVTTRLSSRSVGHALVAVLLFVLWRGHLTLPESSRAVAASTLFDATPVVVATDERGQIGNGWRIAAATGALAISLMAVWWSTGLARARPAPR